MIRLCGERVAQRHGRGHLLGFVLPLLLSLFYIGLPGCILSPSERLSSATNSGYFSIQPSVITSVYGFAEAKLDGFHSSEKSSDRYDQGHPIQLVAPDASHTKFILREEGIRFLQSLPPPITIVSAMGSIHTGKSFLLNQIMGQTSGFELGYTIDPGTSGIWVWSKPMTAYASHYGSRSFSSQAEPDNVSIVLMDTEGFHGPNVTKTYDQTLYAISSLLSSEVLFVSMKMMDSRDLEYLEELTKGANLFALRAYAKSLSTTLEDTTQAQNKIFHWTQDVSKQSAPFADVQTVQTHLQKHGYSAQIVDSLTPSSLTWVVQDFIQDLEGKTPLEWLNNLVDTIARSTPIDRVESAEISKSGSYDHKHTADVTPTRKNSHSLREMYETIDSITLSAPAPVEKMQRLDCLSNKEISSDYLKELDVFRRRLFERALRIYKSRRDSRASILQNSFDTIHGSDMLSGADLADILRFLVRAANQNYFGDIDVFMDQFLQVRADVTKNDLKKLHEAAMSSYLESSPPPLLTEVSFYMKELFERTLSMWKQHVLGDSEKDWAQSTQESLEQLLISVEDEYYHKAEDSIRHYCRTHSRRIHQQDENAVAEKRTFLPSIKSINALKAAINTENRDYTDTTMCMEELQSYSKHTQDLYEELRRENNAAITTRYDSAAKVAIDKFYALVHDPKNALILRSKYKDFEETLFSWKLRAISEFKSYADELVAMEAETSEAEQKLNFQLREPEDTAKKLWEKECERHCNEIANRRTNALRKNVVDSLIFPVEETELKHAVETFLADTENEMRELYCDGSPVWKAKARDLESELRVIHASLENENVEATKRYFKEPLEHVTLALQLDASKYSFWSSFSDLALRKARDAITKNMKMNDATVLQLSDTLVTKVTQNWLETDLYKSYYSLVSKNFYSLMWKYVGIFLLVAGVIVFLFFHWALLGSTCFALGLYFLLGTKILSEIARGAFRGIVIFVFRALQDKIGFELSCITIAIGIVTPSLYILRRWGFLTFNRSREYEIKKYPVGINFQENQLNRNSEPVRFPGLVGNENVAFYKPHPIPSTPYETSSNSRNTFANTNFSLLSEGMKNEVRRRHAQSAR